MRLRTALALSFGLFALDAAGARAQSSGDFGLGIIIGDPTGVSGKYLLSPDHAIDGAVGFGIIGDENFQAHADFLWQFRVQTWRTAALDLYLGVGPKIGIREGGGGPPGRPGRDEAFLLGARGPFGVSVTFLEAPFDVFVEVAAGLWIIEDVDLHVDVAIGGRYWF